MPKVSESTMVRLDKQMKRQVAQIAEREDRSMSSVIRLAVAADLERRQQEAAA
jgi:predicted transcriptional regulator